MKELLISLTCLGVVGVSMETPSALALVRLSDKTITDAVRYGMENQEVGPSLFLGGNWREGQDGALLNIYTPYMQIARSAVHRNLPLRPTDAEVKDARQTMIEDIDYIWHHPTVKFMVSLYGDQPDFGKNYFAVIEGVGRGRTYTLYPKKMVQQRLAEKETDVPVKPYTAINAYHFDFNQIAPLDEFVFKLYGKNIEPITFKIYAKDIQ